MTIRSLHASVAARKRHRPPGDPAVVEAECELRAAVLEEAIRAAVDALPPMRPERRAELARLLAPSTQDDVA